MKSGIQLIAAERARQISVEGWTPENDALYTEAELAVAANQYLTFAGVQIRGRGEVNPPPCFIPPNWPWAHSWWKPSQDPVRNLEKAGALVAAEIDRIHALRGIHPQQEAEDQSAKVLKLLLFARSESVGMKVGAYSAIQEAINLLQA